MQQDPPARTTIPLFSADGNKMQQLFTFVASCCVEPWLGLSVHSQVDEILASSDKQLISFALHRRVYALHTQ